VERIFLPQKETSLRRTNMLSQQDLATQEEFEALLCDGFDSGLTYEEARERAMLTMMDREPKAFN